MEQISRWDLDFFEEAKKGFLCNPAYETYRSKDDDYIALRTGMDEDCIMIYKLGQPVANFTQTLPKRTNKYKKWNELKTYLQELIEVNDGRHTISVYEVLNKMKELE